MEDKNKLSDNSNKKSGSKYNRREILKALATLPVLGIFAQQYLQKTAHKKRKQNLIFEELGISGKAPEAVSNPGGKGDLVRVGIVGFGARGEYLARMLGFAHPGWVNDIKNREAVKTWYEQDDLNVAITGICDVFDKRAEDGLTTAGNSNGREKNTGLPAARRYKSYSEMIASDEIDAVIVTTPDFHHAPISIEAVQNGKHVYCEKCMTRTEDEVYAVEKAVKEAEKKYGVVFQVGHQYKQNSVYTQAKDIIDRGVLGKISVVETASNRNSQWGAWVRHLDQNGNPKPGDPKSIDWEQWLGDSPKVPFSIDRYYNWTKYWDYATGLSGQLFSHEYDSVNQLLDLGIPKSCVASGGIYYWKDGREIPDIFNADFEFPDKELSLLYNATLTSSKSKPRLIRGKDAFMNIGGSLEVYPDSQSDKFKKKLEQGLLDTSTPMISYRPGAENIDAITSASQKYYASRGLIYSYFGNKKLDVTYLHIAEWLNAIRNGTPLSCPIEKGFEVTIACHMATKSYREKRRVEWDPVKRRIV